MAIISKERLYMFLLRFVLDGLIAILGNQLGSHTRHTDRQAHNTKRDAGNLDTQSEQWMDGWA